MYLSEYGVFGCVTQHEYGKSLHTGVILLREEVNILVNIRLKRIQHGILQKFNYPGRQFTFVLFMKNHLEHIRLSSTDDKGESRFIDIPLISYHNKLKIPLLELERLIKLRLEPIPDDDIFQSLMLITFNMLKSRIFCKGCIEVGMHHICNTTTSYMNAKFKTISVIAATFMLGFDVCGPQNNSTNTKDSFEFGVTLIGRNIYFNKDSFKTSIVNIMNNQGVEEIKDKPVYQCL